MADPIVTDSAVEAAKTAGIGGGGAGLGFVLAKLIDRFFSRAEKDEGKLDLVLAAVNALSAKMDVQAERQITTRADVDKLEGIVTALQLELATLRGKFDHLSEQLAK